MLITRWENVLQRLLENVNHSKNFDKLKDESKHLRDATAGLEEAIQAAISDVDLQTQMRNLKVGLIHIIIDYDNLQSYPINFTSKK